MTQEDDDSDTSIDLEIDARKFMKRITGWDGASPPFRECVLAALLHMLLFQESVRVAGDLAQEFDVEPGMIYRWANGTVRPHILVQHRIVDAFHRELEIALTPAIAV